MRPTNEFFKQGIQGYGRIDLDVIQGKLESATQSTGSDQRSYEETQNRYDLIRRIATLEDKVEKLEALIKAQFLNGDKVDDPFGAIYLAELPPDSLDNRNLNQINKFADIEDLSDTIHFDDEWED